MPRVEVFLPIDNIILYLVIAAVFEALAVYLFQFRRIPGALLLVYCQIAKGFWVLAKPFVSLQPDLPGKLFWVNFNEWTPILLTYFWFEFILQVSQQKNRLITVIQVLSRATVVSLLLIISFDSMLGWYWGPMTFDGQVLSIVAGPAAKVNAIFCYALNLLSLGLSVRWVYCSNGLRRQQAVAVSVTPVFNLIGIILGYTFELQAVPPQVPGLLLSAIYVTGVFYWWRIYSILPLAQEAVTRNMNDGLLVVDKKSYIVDLNPAASTILAGIAVTIGDKFSAIIAAWPELAAMGDKPTLEVSRIFNGLQRFYLISTLQCKTPQGHVIGQTFIFKDITEQKRDHAKLMDQQKALSIMAERERLGRELHDGQGQLWSYINVQVEAARSLLDKKDFVQADLLLEKVAGVTQDVHVDLRESITGLQLSATKEGIWQTLDEYLQWFKQNHGIDTELLLSEEVVAGLLPPTTEVQLLRIIQEALTNIRKYAKAQKARVAILVKDDNIVEIQVEDDGCGFDLTAVAAKKGSFGLKIMQERAAEIGAQYQICSKPGTGTKVIVQVTIAEESAADTRKDISL
ncbi:MAG: liaS [Firmicutes bacterium]|nr:liaS [Bacillota bacterium]